MAVRVLGGDQLADPVPVRGRLGEDQVVLVGQREPDVGVTGQPADHIADHAVVDRRAEVGEAPPVVRVEQDQVRLYAQLAEAPQLLVEPGEEVEIEPGVVERPVGRPREGEPLRLVGVVHEVLGEQAHPQLGERRRGQGVQGGLLQGLVLMVPGVRGGPPRPVAGAVRVREMEAVHPDGSVGVRRCRSDRDLATDRRRATGAVDVVTNSQGPSSSASARSR